jgi:hypothetical protein
MLGKIVPILAVIFLVLSGLGAVATPVEDDFELEKISVAFSNPKIIEETEFVNLEIEETNSYLIKQGKPLLPKQTETFTFPFGTKIKDVKVTPIQTQEQTLDKRIMASPKAVTVGNKITKTVQEETNEAYPDKWYDFKVTTGLVGQERMVQVTLDILPIQYFPEKQSIEYAKSVDIEIKYELPEVTEISSNQEYNLIILTADEFYNDLQALKTHKINRGVPTEIFRLSQILNSQGQDDQEKIKYFIKDAIEEYGTTNVLLVGTWYKNDDDLHKFPVRLTHVYMDDSDNDEFVSDLYYADIYDGEGEFASWDTNDNQIYGEYHETLTSKRDDVDLHPDVALGRIAAKDSSEVTTYVNKVIAYENQEAYTQNWFTDLVVVGGDSFIDEEYDPDQVLEGELVNQEVMDIMDGFIPKKMWVTNGVLGRALPTGVSSISDAIDDGCGFIDWSGHGNTNIWATHPHGNDRTWLPTPAGGYRSSNVDDLNNGNELPVVVTGACSVGKFYKDKNCFSMSWLTNENGGGIASFGATALGYAYISSYVTYGLVERIGMNMFDAYKDGAITIGEMWTRGINDYLKSPGLDSDADYKTIEEWQFFGDPTLQIAEESIPPVKPDAPDGQAQGNTGTQYTFSASTTDDDNDELYYLFDWGDGSYSGWQGPKDSGELITASHTWSSDGNYEIRVKAKDEHGVQSEWSEPLSISMPRNRDINYPFLEKLLEIFPNFLPFLKIFLG